MSTRTILTALLATALSIPALAQSATPPAAATTTPPAAAAAAPATPAPAAPAVSVEGAAPVAAGATRDKDTLSVDFPDEDIKTILRNVADLFELNLVVPEGLTGKTSIKLRDVTWEQIFTVVLSPVGYTYIKEGNIIKIVSNEILQQEPGATEVFVLNNAKAADIKPTIDGLIDTAGGGKIVIDARSNALVITEKPSRMSRIRSIIDQLDKATDQVMIESKFVEVTDRDVRNIGVNWSSLSGMSLGVGQISQTFNKGTSQTSQNGNTLNNATNGTTTNGNTVTNTTTTAGNTTTGNTSSATTTNTGATNTSTTQTNTGNQLLPVTTTDPSTGATTTSYQVQPINSTGTQSSTSTPATQTNSTSGTTGAGTSSVDTSVVGAISNGVNNTVTSALNSLTGIVNNGSTSRVATAVFSASDFNVIISALKTNNNAKIVSNPTIVTLNNTEAVLNIGQDFPIPKYTYNEQRGTFEVAGFDYKSIGVNLKVTPQVNGRGVIKLVLEPEVSQQNGNSLFNGAAIPVIATRKAKTQVSLKDGYTMGIGGLITSSTNHGGTKVPVLGDIPLLGRLFSSTSVDDSATNLIIFITAKTVSADGASPEEVFDPRAIQAIGMTREDLPGNRASKGTDLFAPAPESKK